MESIKNAINLTGNRFNPASNVVDKKESVRIIERRPERLLNTQRSLNESFVNKGSTGKAYQPNPFLENAQSLYQKNGFTDLLTTYTIGTGSSNGYINNKEVKRSINSEPSIHQITSIGASRLNGVANLPQNATGLEFNKQVADKKLQSEADNRKAMIDDYRTILHKKRPPGSIQSTPNSRS